MVKPIVHDPFFLSRKSIPATWADLHAAQDLLDTLEASRDRCVGMAANMIGVSRRIIVAVVDGRTLLMFNPRILSHAGKRFETAEGCLCHQGTKPARRWPTITVRYQDRNFETKTDTFSGFSAQIIQHEMDHLEGILI